MNNIAKEQFIFPRSMLKNVITSDAVSLKVDPLQCDYFSELLREDGEVIIRQIDASHMLHFPHLVWQFGENIALQVKFCKAHKERERDRVCFLVQTEYEKQQPHIRL